MLHLLSFVLPPVAVLMTGRLFIDLLNLGLSILGFVPGIIHALFVVHEHKANKRAQKYGGAI